MPTSGIGAGNRSHFLGLIDRAKQRLPNCRVIKRRMQVVEAQYADGGGILGNDSDVAIASDLVDEVAGRRLPPVNFTAARGDGRVGSVHRRRGCR